MKSLYLAYCTEYESGWGSRPDGIVLAKSLNDIKAHIKEDEERGNYDLFWRYDEPVEVICTDEVYDEIISKLNDAGIVWREKTDIKKYGLMKKI